MNTLKAAAVALFAITSSAAHAEDNTGYNLLTSCEADPNDPTHYVEESYCTGFIGGVWAGADFATALKGQAAPWCRDESHNYTLGQLVLIYRRWAHQNPQFLDKPSGLAVLAAFTGAFPCRR